MHFAQRKIVEFEAQGGRDVRVTLLFVRQHDVHAQRGLACFVGAAVGRFHDARAATGADVQAVFARLACAVLGHHAAKSAGFFVVHGVAQGALGFLDARRRTFRLGLGHLLTRLGFIDKTCAAIDHDGVFNALGRLLYVGLEHFQLKANATRFSAEQKFGVSESQPIGVG